MSDYISRDAAIDAICRDCIDTLCCGVCEDTDAIRRIPAADVREVKRGKWRFEEGDGETCSDGWVCSACSYGFHTHVPYFGDFNFCPNCGAWMEES